MHVRLATRDDLPAILDIYNDAVLNTTATYDYEPSTMEHRAAWFDAHEQQRLPIFVAVNDDARVIGWSSLSQYRDRKGYQFTVENSVYVAAAERGRGVGTLLMPPLIESAESLGLRAIIAAIDAENRSSIRLHARFGFLEVGNFKQVGFKFGRWLDVVYMQRLMDEPSAERSVTP
jgi:phosphinothricin acetyltransferase